MHIAGYGQRTAVMVHRVRNGAGTFEHLCGRETVRVEALHRTICY